MRSNILAEEVAARRAAAPVSYIISCCQNYHYISVYYSAASQQ